MTVEVRRRGSAFSGEDVLRANVLWQAVGAATHDELVKLSLLPSAHVIRAARQRIKDGKPFAYEVVAIPAHLVPATDPAAALPEMCALAAANNLRLGLARETLTGLAADSTVALALGVPVGERIVRLERVVWMASGRPLEWRRTYMRPVPAGHRLC